MSNAPTIPPSRKSPVNRACDEPITGGHGKPSRAARREANRLAKAKAQVAELAAAANPPVAWVDVFSPQENQPAPGQAPVPGLLTAQERMLRSKEERNSILGTGTLPAGRPSDYTPEEGDAICAFIQAGGSLRGYCKRTGRAPLTVYRWMRQNAVFHTQYSSAHEDRADTLTDEMLEIGDDAAVEATMEGVAAAKLRVDTRKWIASKLRPQKWGDKQTVEHVGAVNIRIGIPSKPQPTAVEMVDVIDVPHVSR